MWFLVAYSLPPLWLEISCMYFYLGEVEAQTFEGRAACTGDWHWEARNFINLQTGGTFFVLQYLVEKRVFRVVVVHCIAPKEMRGKEHRIHCLDERALIMCTNGDHLQSIRTNGRVIP